MNDNGGQTDSLAGLVEQGLAVMRVENETQSQIAIRRPRDFAKVVDKSIAELAALPEFASKAYYMIPYRDGDGGNVEVSGLSIRAAMALARHWGNCANGGRIIQDMGSEYILEGVFLDYETNLRTLRQVRVSKSVWRKSSQTVVPLREDRLTTAIQAGISKAVRNAILASLPESLKERYFAEAKKIAQSGKSAPSKKAEPIKKRIEKMFAAFKEFGVESPQILGYLKHKKEADITEDELGKLIGIYNAISDGQIDAAEVFNIEKGKSERQESGEATVDAMLSGEKPSKLPATFGEKETSDIMQAVLSMKKPEDSTQILKIVQKALSEALVTDAQGQYIIGQMKTKVALLEREASKQKR